MHSVFKILLLDSLIEYANIFVLEIKPDTELEFPVVA